MLAILKNHPFAVEAFFESSVVLTFAVPVEELQSFIPVCLKPDIFDGKWAFIAIAMVQTSALRPKGFLKMFGNNFFLTGYRIFVCYTNNAGKRLRGLYIIKSETDKKKMEWLGNVFTHYQYTTTDILQTYKDGMLTIQSKQSDFKLLIDLHEETVALPVHSPFSDWKQARKYAGPLPFTFSYNAKTNKVLIVEGVRQNWIPKPLKIVDYHFSFLQNLEFSQIHLASAFIINAIPYYWKKGRQELWKG